MGVSFPDGRRLVGVLTRLHHLAVAVPALEYGYAFFSDVLGLPAVAHAVVEAQGVRAALLDGGGVEVELLEPLDSDNPVGRFLARGGGLHHICFASTDVDADLTAAARAGAELLDETGRAGLAGRIGFLHPRATNGILTEFAEPGGSVPVAPPPPRFSASAVHAGRVTAVEAVAADPCATAAVLGALTGHPSVGDTLEVGDVPVRFGPAETRPGLTGLVFARGDATLDRLHDRGVPAREDVGGLVIDPGDALGVRVTLANV